MLNGYEGEEPVDEEELDALIVEEPAPPEPQGNLARNAAVCLFALLAAWGLARLPWRPFTRAVHYLKVAVTADFGPQIERLGRGAATREVGTVDAQDVMARLKFWDRQSFSGLIWPVTGPAVPSSSAFAGGETGEPVQGLDIEAAPREIVRAAASGSVAAVLPVSGGTYTIVIDHSGGWQSSCSGLAAIYVSRGEKLAAGQRIGLMPSAEPIVLHFELSLNGKSVDPLSYLPERV